MKREREYIELSEDEWSTHTDSFKPSRILNNNNNKPQNPPPIESFAFSNKSNTNNNFTPVNVIECSSSSEELLPVNNRIQDDLEDDDAQVLSTRVTRRNRFIIEDDEDDNHNDDNANANVNVNNNDYDDVNWTDDEEEVEEEEEEEDVVKNALKKCERISKELKQELYGTSNAVFDRYSEVEMDSSAVRIVTQEDVNEACGEGEDDDGFKPILKPYQLLGVNFLLLLYRKKIGGAILADEMGLGKTVQAITYLTLLRHLEDDDGPHLIVCPASVLENWERELRKWCPSFSVLQYHGSARAAHARELSSLGKAGKPPPYDVILVCYSLFERHSAQQKDDRKILRLWRWSCVIMDEAHALKDKNSYRWKNLMSVTRTAKQRLMLTGTPLQNDLHELWSMLEFMMPDLFETGDVDLKKLLNAEDRELVFRMKSILGPFILRRLKSDVMQQLIPKNQMVEYVKMGKKQEDAYNKAIDNYRVLSESRAVKSSEGKPKAASISRRQISNYFHEFRKIANHPLLVRHNYTDQDIIVFAKMLRQKGVFGFECTIERVIDEMKSYNDFSIHKLLLYYGDEKMNRTLSEDHVMSSGKCQALSELLPALKRSGHRVLIFSQWTSMLDILEWALDVIGVTYSRLDGSTQVTDRQTIVDSFNKDSKIFACLLSTRAGGQGLNLTGADTVIIHDMDFNPQIDRQAEDRCHRIGQTKTVTIYRLVTKDTVDENVYEIAKRKLKLDAAVLDGGEVENEGEIPDKTMADILSSLLQ